MLMALHVLFGGARCSPAAQGSLRGRRPTQVKGRCFFKGLYLFLVSCNLALEHAMLDFPKCLACVLAIRPKGVRCDFLSGLA